MDDERDPSPPGDGPYRTPPARLAADKRWVKWAIAGGVACALIATALLWPEDDERGRPSLTSLPPGLFDDVNAWPLPEDDLPPSTPLAPLLVADQPQALAVLSPGEGAIRLRRGEGLSVRFNRPMVEGREVGRELETSPLAFRPSIPGTARWTSRSQVSFAPDPSAWRSGVREVRLEFAEGLAAMSGELLVDDYERVVVLDGAPRVDSYRSSGRVNAGGAAAALLRRARADGVARARAARLRDRRRAALPRRDAHRGAQPARARLPRRRPAAARARAGRARPPSRSRRATSRGAARAPPS